MISVIVFLACLIITGTYAKLAYKSNQLTPEQATAVMGKKLFDRYVPQSQTPTAPALKYEDFYKQM